MIFTVFCTETCGRCGGEGVVSSPENTERVCCPECQGNKETKREVLLQDALRELGVLGVFDERRCRVCGCTDDWACEGGCSWVEEDLCSACVNKEEGRA